MASILNRSINDKLLLAVGSSCFSPVRSQSNPVGLHDPLLRIAILPARVSTQKTQLKTAHSVRLYAAAHKQGFRNPTATGSPRGRDRAFDFPPTFAIKRMRAYGMGYGMERDT